MLYLADSLHWYLLLDIGSATSGSSAEKYLVIVVGVV